MSVATYTVSSAQPVSVYPAGLQVALLVRNNDSTNHVFLSDLASGAGFDLGPGSAITWEAGKPLYASVTQGFPVMLAILDNGGPLFDASAIAAQILVSGAPPVDNNVIIASGVYTSTTTVDQLTASIDTSRYQSIMIRIVEKTATSKPAPIPRRYQLLWAVTNIPNQGILTQDSEDFYFTDCNNLILGSDLIYYDTYQTAVKSALLTVGVFPTSEIDKQIVWQIVGSYKTVAKPRYVNRSAYFGVSGGTISGTGVDNFASIKYAGALANLNDFPPTKAGQARFTVYTSDVTVAPVTCYIRDVITSNVLVAFTFPLSAVTQIQTSTMFLSNRPVDFYILGGSSAIAELILVYLE